MSILNQIPMICSGLESGQRLYLDSERQLQAGAKARAPKGNLLEMAQYIHAVVASREMQVEHYDTSGLKRALTSKIHYLQNKVSGTWYRLFGDVAKANKAIAHLRAAYRILYETSDRIDLAVATLQRLISTPDTLQEMEACLQRYRREGILARVLSTQSQYRCEWGPMTALSLAVQRANLPCLKLLVQYDASVNGPQAAEGASPLHLAHSPAVVSYLLAQGAQVTARDHAGKTPMQYMPWDKLTMRLFDRMIERLGNDERQALAYTLCEQMQATIEVVQRRLGVSACPGWVMRVYGNFIQHTGHIPLDAVPQQYRNYLEEKERHSASLGWDLQVLGRALDQGSTEEILYLIEHCTAALQSRIYYQMKWGPNKESLLHQAVSNPKISDKVIIALLDVLPTDALFERTQGPAGYTPLDYAICRERYSLIPVFLDKGSGCTRDERHAHMLWALECAVKECNPRAIEILLAYNQTHDKFDFTTKAFRRVNLQEADTIKTFYVFAVLQQHGIRWIETQEIGESVLESAVRSRRKLLIVQLVSAGVRIDFRMIELARELGFQDIASFLEQGLSLKTVVACRLLGNARSSSQNLSLGNNQMSTPLLQAVDDATYASLETMKRLLQQDEQLDINAAMHHALRRGNTLAMWLLLVDRRFDPTAVDQEGRTPAQLAEELNYPQFVIEMLRQPTHDTTDLLASLI